jgi:hypothetical protein
MSRSEGTSTVSSVDLIYKGVRIAGGTPVSSTRIYTCTPLLQCPLLTYGLALDAAQLVLQISVLELELRLDPLAPPWYNRYSSAQNSQSLHQVQ